MAFVLHLITQSKTRLTTRELHGKVSTRSEQMFLFGTIRGQAPAITSQDNDSEAMCCMHLNELAVALTAIPHEPCKESNEKTIWRFDSHV